MSPVSGGPDVPQGNMSNLPDLLRAITVKVYVKDRKLST